MSTTQSKLTAVLHIFRFEYIYATLPGMTITFFLCAQSPSSLLSLRVIEGLAIVGLMIFAGLGINSVIDRHVDYKYPTHKNRIPASIRLIGLRTTWSIILIQIALAVVLAVHLALQSGTGYWFVLVLVAAEAFFGYGYSIPPLQFKLRGVFWHGVSLMLSTCIIPLLLSTYTYLGNIPISLLMFIVGFALVQYGFEFSNQALDYLEDRQEGLKTPAVRLGVPGSMQASLLVPIAGMIIVFGGLYWHISARWDTVDNRHIFPNMYLTWIASICVMAIGYIVPMRNIWKMYIVSRKHAPEETVPKLLALCHYSQWQASSVSGTAGATAIFYISSNYLW